MSQRCQICGNNENKIHRVREKNFGSNEEFFYLECINCGTMQIKNVPKNMEQYYRVEYHPHLPFNARFEDLHLRLIRWLSGRKGLIHNTCRALVNPFISVDLGLEAVLRLFPSISWRIMDIGCGNGNLVKRLQRIGFQNAFGIDPFLPNFLIENNSNIFRKTDIWQLDKNESYDLIILNHVFEHMESPLNVLKHLKGFLTGTGQMIIRLPLAGSDAWSIFGPNWVQLDPPRHLFLHTLKGISIMVKEAGLKILNVYFDSTGFQFWGSRLCRTDRPLIKETKRRNFFSFFWSLPLRLTDEFRAVMVNRKQSGDQACIYLGLDK